MAAADASQQGAPRRFRRLSDDQRLNALRLIRTENVGPVSYRILINQFGSAEAALDALPDLAKRGGRTIVPLSRQAAETELAAASRFGAELVAPGEPGYPAALINMDVPPPLIYAKGRLELAERPIVALVGARNGSALGQKFTRLLATELGIAGFVIASGLARGIDTAAHTAALERGTVAILAGGIDNIYPPQNAELHAAIGTNGLLISERPFGFVPRAQDFPRRNRLISGVALGVAVIEAAKRSGSLITARFAAEQGREVFAVPGNPLDPRAAGTNGLIRQGATLVTAAADIVEALEPIQGQRRGPLPELDAANDQPAPTPPPPVTPSERERIVEALGAAPVDIDEVIRVTGVSARTVQIVLLELDLAGRLTRHGQQLVSLANDVGTPS